ncbi:hypothetical protein [Actinomadura rubrisoli]|uniref:Uncharacterized protein n=1 Tax=Actinomadura rubrisoli TaxID=2530368 RepID=A0A4R5AZV4_9ACTN|nr:hypothetical protein [Actinomadura rubrisoli]TDD77720.1 hypothetical protein E1298_29775 [Actinomadura rubrisoli]
MGWASGGAIFDRVADALIASRANDDLLRSTLGPLIDELRNGDWDTEDESLERFARVPVIVQLFADRNVLLPVDDDISQVLVAHGIAIRVGGFLFDDAGREHFADLVKAVLKRRGATG